MWLLESSALKTYEAAKTSGTQPTEEQLKTFVALHGSSGAGESRILNVAGNQAEISIQGIMTNKPDIMAMLFGGGNVTYPEIVSAFALADSNEAVTDITVNMNSNGGEFIGLFDVLAAMQTTSKPINVIVSGVAASGAYAIAAQADTIKVSNKSAILGSIGVARSFYVSDFVVDIASTNAPNKRPNAKTLEGQAAIRSELDVMHEIFVESIAAGRNTTIENVNANFGRGGILLAQDAFDVGMIDGMVTGKLNTNTNKQRQIMNSSKTTTTTTTKTTTANGNNQPRVKKMDLETLKIEHPGVYAAAVAVGNEAGVNEERDRVTAHLVMGEAADAMTTAVTAIKDGTSASSQTVQAAYFAAGLTRNDISARQGDNVDLNANGITDTGATGSGGSGDDDEAAQVATLVENKMGLQGVA